MRPLRDVTVDTVSHWISLTKPAPNAEMWIRKVRFCWVWGKSMGGLAKVLKERSGQSAVWLAAFLGMLALGFMALAVDTGYFFHERRMAQSAADAAAIAAAEEASAGASGNMQSVANAISKMNGF